MHKKEIFIFLFIGTMILSGCSRRANQNIQENTESLSYQNNSIVEIDISDMFSARDKEIGYPEEESVSVVLSDEGTVCESDAVIVEDKRITITKEGTYVLTGNLTDGMVMVETKDTDKVQLVLNDVNISNSESAALYVFSADKVFVTTVAGSENTLENGGNYIAIDESNIDAAVFSKSDLTFNGEGKLTVTARAGHGIVSKDDLVFTCGTYEIISADHGIAGKDSVRIANGSYKIISGKDGIHAENAEDTNLGFVYLADGTFQITSEQDGISAGSWLQAENGVYTITTGEGSAGAGTSNVQEHMQKRMPAERNFEENFEEATEEDSESIKGLKAGTQMVLKEGTYTLDSQDDSLHFNGAINIRGGTYKLSSGDDGIHADTNVLILGGSLDITQSYEGIEGLSIDITGGEINVQALDDGINAAGGNDGSGFGGPGPGDDPFATTEGAYICISGGILHINASGDGIDSNGDITVSGGETYVSGPVNDGNAALDYNGTATITGGVFAAAGASGMAQNFGNSSTQGVIMVNSNMQEAGTQISLTDSSGTKLLSWSTEKEYSSVIVSCPEIKQGETYTLTAGTAQESITMDSLVYGNSPQMGGQPGRDGRGGGMRNERMRNNEMRNGGMPN